MTLYNAPNRAAKVLAGEWATLADDYHWHIGVLPRPERLKRVGGIYVNTSAPRRMPPRPSGRPGNRVKPEGTA